MTSPAFDRLNTGYYNNNLMTGANPGGLAGTGAVRKNFFLGLIVDLCTVVAEAAASAAAALTSSNNAAGFASTAVNAPGTQADTITNIVPAAGAINFTLVQANKAFGLGQWVSVGSKAAAATKWVVGQISGFDPVAKTMTINVPAGYFAGAAFADGTVTVSGPPGTTNVPNTRQVTGSGLATGGGDLSVDRAINVPAAAAADIRTGTDTTKAATSAALTNSAAVIPLTYAATVAWDTAQGYNATVTLGGNGVIGAPANLKDGVTYSLELVQDATGSRVPTWNAIWDFGSAGAPTLQAAAGKADKVFAQYNARTGKLDATFRRGA